MDSLGEKIWGRGSAREIMKEARKRFRQQVEINPTGAHVALASAHYSPVKRYIAPAPLWQRHLAVWHLRRAVVHARKAIRMKIGNYDQIDVVATILAKAPRWLGGDKHLALSLIDGALRYTPIVEPLDEMETHTRAFLLERKGELEMALGKSASEVAEYYIAAVRLRRLILAEPDKLMAKRQWVRIAAAAGFFFWYNRAVLQGKVPQLGDDPYNLANDYLTEALKMAREVSLDQYRKILTEIDRNHITID